MSAPDITTIARTEGESEDHVVREVLQARIVSEIFARRIGRDIVMKGGLAMRAAFGSRRYTKDIDLHSGPDVPTARSQSVVRQSIHAALAGGLLERTEVTSPKMTDTVQRWKVRGYRGETLVTLTVELSRRGKVPAADRQVIPYAPPGSYGIGPILVETYVPTAMAAAKVAALGDVRREAPRDLYDLDLLIRSEIQPPIENLSRLGAERLREIRDILSDKVEKLDYRAARDELVDHLPRAQAESFDAGTWAEMQARVYLSVSEWLEKAIELSEANEMQSGMRLSA